MPVAVDIQIYVECRIRHSCLVNGVDTARDAVDRAVASGEVGSWECSTAKYLDPDGPEVLPV